MAKRKKKNLINNIGGWAFLVGVIIAIIAGFFPIGGPTTSVLIVLGLVVGFLNVTGDEVNNFLFAALVLVIVASMGGNMLGQIGSIGKYLQGIFSGMLLFIVPAAVVVALKSILFLERE